MTEHDIDLDELRVSREETLASALQMSARLAERVSDHCHDDVVAVALANSLLPLLRQERSLRRIIVREISG